MKRIWIKSFSIRSCEVNCKRHIDSPATSKVIHKVRHFNYLELIDCQSSSSCSSINKLKVSLPILELSQACSKASIYRVSSSLIICPNFYLDWEVPIGVAKSRSLNLLRIPNRCNSSVNNRSLVHSNEFSLIHSSSLF